MHICHARHYSTLRNVHYRKRKKEEEGCNVVLILKLVGIVGYTTKNMENIKFSENRPNARTETLKREQARGHWTYNGCLMACNLLTLQYRHIRGNMIERYKIVTRTCDPVVSPAMVKSSAYVIRGNNLRLQIHIMI